MTQWLNPRPGPRCLVQPRRRASIPLLQWVAWLGGALLLASAPAVAQDGLLGEYFDDTSLTQLADTRLDAQVDFTGWQGAPPGTAVAPDDAFSERWTGYVRLDTPGKWTFSTNSNDGVRLQVAGQMLIDNWTLHAVTLDSASVQLTAGWHALTLEHFQMGGGMAMQLYFQGPGQSLSIIPSDHLSVGAGGNLPPLVSAGADLMVLQPGNSVTLDGSVADQDGVVVSIAWSQVSGPPATLVDATKATLLVNDMNASGVYGFRVDVTDDGGVQASDFVEVSVVSCSGGGPEAGGTLRPWHRMKLDFLGPYLNEGGNPNPFRDYRLNVEFTHAATGTRYTVPGFFNADGRPDETGATGGKVWRVWFSPDRAGDWFYSASFRTGPDVAVSLDPSAGLPTAFDGTTGCFQVAPALPAGPGFRADGRIGYTQEHHLRHVGSGKPFLKGGANSPENLLSYVDFDQTPNAAHAYSPHLSDWQAGDPSWKGGRGKALVGALNYLAAQGMNSVYFLTFNVGGDGEDVWMWTSSSERERFDLSKLAQWETVFEHMDDLGLALHVVTQEQENDTGALALDDGDLGLERMLYYRELVARFGHHLGVVWNLGEENTNSSGELQEFYDYLSALDAYDHPVVVHSFPGEQGDVYGPLLDLDRLEGVSLQSDSPGDVHAQTLQWRDESELHGRPWFVASDETGPASMGVVPDSVDPEHDVPRQEILWGNLMAGGAGVEWYFGYGYPNDDLDCEDWRSRHTMWTQTGHALSFFEEHLPFTDMQPDDSLTDNPAAWCLAEPGRTYAVYVRDGSATKLDLGAAGRTFDVSWFDPRNGGPLQMGSVAQVTGPGMRSLGVPPGSPAGDDWVARVQLVNSPPTVVSVRAQPDPFAGNGDLGVLVSVSDSDGLNDIQSVSTLLISPDLSWKVLVPCQELSPGLFGFIASDVPPIMPGTWWIAGLAVDATGASHYLVGSFEAL